METMSKGEWIKEIRQEVIRKRELTNISEAEMDEQLLSLVEEEVFQKARELHIGVMEKKQLVDSVFNSLRRLDILEPLLKDPSITEIMINGPEHIFVEKNGRSQRIPLAFEGREQLEDMVQRIVSRVNRSVNEAQPIVDARLSDGS
ncbi:MAG: Flp pilus assembly complex ATPase component TadA, partial [Ruminiclostridium sp.]|nr:Flp pilus assembly complex ATPase component TadA [Ruminiclostridium sp.]